MAIKVISITTMNCIFSISRILKLDEGIARRSWWDLQIDLNNRSILTEQIFDFSLADIAGKVPDVYGSTRTAAHLILNEN